MNSADNSINVELYRLETIYEYLKEKDADLKNCDVDAFVKKLGDMFNIIIKHQREHNIFFEFLVENNLIGFLRSILRNANFLKIRKITISALKALSMLVFNTKTQASMFYILSHKDILEIVMMISYDFTDYDITSYFVNIIKSLVNHAKETSLTLFYNSRYYYFPLLYRLISFYNHPEGLIRTTVQNCVIGFINTDDEPLKRYLASIPFVNYYVANSLFVRDYLSSVIDLVSNEKKDAKHVMGKIETFTDNVYLVTDIIHSNLPLIGLIHFEIFSRFVFLPLMRSFNGKRAILDSTKKLNIYILKIIMSVVEDERSIDFFSLVLFSPFFSGQFHENITQIFPDPEFHKSNLIDPPLFDYNSDECKKLLLAAVEGDFDPHKDYEEYLNKKKSLMEAHSNSEATSPDKFNPFSRGGDKDQKSAELNFQENSPSKAEPGKEGLLSNIIGKIHRKYSDFTELAFGDKSYDNLLYKLVHNDSTLLTYEMEREKERVFKQFSTKISPVAPDEHWKKNTYMEYFVNLFRTKDSNQSLLNCVFIEWVLKSLHKSRILCHLWTSISISIDDQERPGRTHNSLIDFALFELIAFFNFHVGSRSLSKKYLINTMEAILEYKKKEKHPIEALFYLECQTCYRTNLSNCINCLDSFKTVNHILDALPYFTSLPKNEKMILKKSDLATCVASEDEVLDINKSSRPRATTKMEELSNLIIWDSVKKVLLMMDYRYLFRKESKRTKFERDIISQVNSFRSKFNSYHWITGKIYDLRALNKHSCKISLSNSKKITAYIIQDHLHFVIAEKVTKGYKILIKEAMSQMAFDYKAKYILCRKKHKNNGLEIKFGDKVICQSVQLELQSTAESIIMKEGAFVQEIFMKLLEDSDFPETDEFTELQECNPFEDEPILEMKEEEKVDANEIQEDPSESSEKDKKEQELFSHLFGGDINTNGRTTKSNPNK